MPEGDTIHRAARRIGAALGGRTIALADAPNPRSPLHDRAGELGGRVLERAEARGKHLLLHFSGNAVVHSHLGINGRWFVRGDGSRPHGRAWLSLAGDGGGLAVQNGGKLLRLTSAARARNDPALLQLGTDPLAPGFDPEAAARRLTAVESSERVGAALLDQGVIAGFGNVIRIEACWLAGVSPWRRVGDLRLAEAQELVGRGRWVMEEALRTGSRPKQIYGRERRPCPRCGGRIRTHGQGDDNRVTLWCESCQR
jgi:endonuclease VIII